MRIGGWWVLVGDELGCDGKEEPKTGRTEGRMDVLMLPTKLYMLL